MTARLENVCVDYAGARVLGPFSLSAAAGEIVALVGPSGCGKSTALRLLAGLEPASAGRVEIDVPPGRTSMVFQAPTLMPWASARANAALPLELAGAAKADAIAQAEAMLAKVGLTGAETRKPAQLSGGMAMRVAFARALVSGPDLLLLDEPFAALDEITRRRLAEDVHRLWSERRPTIVFVTHSVDEAVYMAHRVVVMTSGPGRVAGEVAIEGPIPRPGTFRTSETARHAAERVSAMLATTMEKAG